jgi:hypothetical protein
MTVTIHTCAECPLAEEGPVEGDFYCKHKGRDDKLGGERLDVFGKPPDWCPIRKTRLVVHVEGGV